MTITLTQARTRVRFLIDDADANPLVTDAEIDVALATAQEEVWERVVGAGVNVYTTSAFISSDATGLVSLTSLKPLRVSHVALRNGTAFRNVKPARGGDYSGTVASVQTLRVLYVPRAAFPTLVGDPFVWSTAAVSAPTLDQLMCVVAASDVWVKTGEAPLKSLEMRKAELNASVESKINIPSWSVVPLRASSQFPDDRGAGFLWTMTGPDTMQLVYP